MLIDQNIKFLTNDDHQHHLENYDETFVVGKDLKQREYDEGLAKFCLDNECDLMTADIGHILIFLLKKLTPYKFLNYFMTKRLIDLFIWCE